MYLLPLTLLCTPSPLVDSVPERPALMLFQEPVEQPSQEPQEEKPKKKKFARLTSPQKKQVATAMRQIAKGEDEEEIEAGVAQLLGIGEAAIPSCFDAVKRMEEAGRTALLWQVLDGILADADLPLAWKLLKKKSPAVLRAYLVRRYADSSQEKAEAFLKEQVQVEDPEIAYQAARGLALRGEASVVPILERQVATYWLEEAARLRADFAGVTRGPLVDAVLPLLERKRTKEKLAALRMFELFGTAETIKVVAPFLSESDTTLRLAAINACRVVVKGEEPLARPSMTEIIERAEAWKAQL